MERSTKKYLLWMLAWLLGAVVQAVLTHWATAVLLFLLAVDNALLATTDRLVIAQREHIALLEEEARRARRN